jgi:hypothetical protein
LPLIASRSRVGWPDAYDERARQMLAMRQQARQALKGGDASHLVRLHAAHTPILTVWRTDADLRCLDLRQDPSDRPAGSVWGADMLASNYGAMGFGRLCTPESWLSTWSGLSSHAALEKTAPSLERKRPAIPS